MTEIGPEVSTPVGEAPVVPLVLLGIGMYLAWFGVHYWRTDQKWPTDPVKSVLQGKGLPSAAKEASINLTSDISSVAQSGTGGSSSPAGGSSSTGSAIADAALRYRGQGYVWGGNASNPGNWDCSSFVSYVLGHDLHMALPGGHWGDPGFPPNSHGPTTIQYMVFGSPIGLAQVQAGDLIVSTEHIGIAISPTQMISAQDPQLGTNVGGFPAGFPAGPPVYRRVSSAAAAAVTVV